jgi:hypothetical protein
LCGVAAQQDVAGSRRGLQACRKDNGITERCVVRPNFISDPADYDETGCDAHSEFDSSPIQRTTNGTPHLERSHDSARDVVLVCNGSTEQGHKAVAEKLIHCSTQTMDTRNGDIEEFADEIPELLRSKPLDKCARPHDVAEQHCDVLAFALGPQGGRKDLIGQVSHIPTG